MYDNLKNRRVSIYSLGCKVNQYEADAMLEALMEHGCQRTADGEIADIYIINTCSVTNMADRKSRQMIHRMKKQNPDAIIAATGCYVQAAGDTLLKDSSLDLIIGNNRKSDIARILDEYISSGSVTDNYIDVNNDPEFENLSVVMPENHTRAYVKIQDGCNEFCTYCIIPYVRGRIKSKRLEDIISEVTTLAHNDVKEIILTGINVSAYHDESAELIDVIKSVSEIDGIDRIRLSSMDPRIITKSFLDILSDIPGFCPHFHLSLQSACNRTLKAMNRKYTIEEYMEACRLIRKYFDSPAITTDIIVGFPGETDEDFEETYRNLELLELYEMHIFKYSRRRGTVADRLDNQVDEQIKTNRSNRLLELTAVQKARFEELNAGKEKEVLIEEIIEKDGRMYFRGHSKRYILVDILVDEICGEDEAPKSYINKIIKLNSNGK